MDSKEKEQQFNFNLIEFVKANPVLYDPKHKDSRDNTVKTAIFRKFAEENSLDSEFVIRRWSNLRNSYQRIKRETRHIPDANGQQKSGKVWVYFESLKFLDALGPNFYSHRTHSEPKRRRTVDRKPHRNGNDTMNELFTQSMDTYSSDDGTMDDDNGTNLTNNSASYNTNEILQFNNQILTSIDHLSGNIRELVSNQTKPPAQPSAAATDNITLYLNSLRPLLEPFANDSLKFAKLQLKINQIVVDEIEKSQTA